MATGSVQDIKSSKFWVAAVAEFIGTLLLVLVACGACARFDVKLHDDVVQIALAFGLSVATIVWIIGHVSGGHINPAVTIGFLVTRRISILRALVYILAQTAGAVVGAGLLNLVSPDGVNDKLGSTFPSTALAEEKFATFLVEMIISLVLVLTVFASCDSQRSGFNGSAPLAIGLSIAMCHLWAVPYTGAGMNPARAFGSAVMSGDIKDNVAIHALYWLGPLLGGAIAALLYDHLFAVNASVAKSKAFFTSRDYDDSQFDSNGRKADTAAGDDSTNKADDLQLKETTAE